MGITRRKIISLLLACGVLPCRAASNSTFGGREGGTLDSELCVPSRRLQTMDIAHRSICIGMKAGHWHAYICTLYFLIFHQARVNAAGMGSFGFNTLRQVVHTVHPCGLVCGVSSLIFFTGRRVCHQTLHKHTSIFVASLPLSSMEICAPAVKFVAHLTISLSVSARDFEFRQFVLLRHCLWCQWFSMGNEMDETMGYT